MRTVPTPDVTLECPALQGREGRQESQGPHAPDMKKPQVTASESWG